MNTANTKPLIKPICGGWNWANTINKKDKQTLTDQFGFAFGNSFIYGKINNFYFLKAGFGQQLLIGGKGNQNGVAYRSFMAAA